MTLRLYRVGDAVGVLRERDVMRGRQVGATRRLARVARGQAIQLPLDPRWRSGFYYAKLTAPVGRVGYAPFVLAPQRLGEQRIAVVLPTQSWQAYNFRDDDGNGTADTWYAWRIDTARLHRPFENRGVPGHYRHYDEPFLRWLDRNDYPVDFLSDAELKATSGRVLAEAYDLIIFPGHHEYVTQHEFDAVAGFRDRGGNLIFLSGNNFFRKVTISGNVMTRIGDWPEHGRSPAALVGVQWFLGCASPGSSGKPWTVKDTPAGRWIFRGTGLRPGSPFSSGGIEADAVTPASPKGTQVVAEIRNVFGNEPRRPHDLLRGSLGREGLRRGRLHARRRDLAAAGAEDGGKPDRRALAAGRLRGAVETPMRRLPVATRVAVLGAAALVALTAGAD